MTRLPPELAGEGALERIFAHQPCAPMRQVAGRATFAWPGATGIVVKRYARSEWRDLAGDWLRGIQPRSAGRREALNLDLLAQDGIEVPRALGTWDQGRAFGDAPSALAMQRIEHDCHLRQLAERDPAAARGWLEALADMVAKLHAAGWYHRDLYLQHVVIDRERNCLVLLDVGRARKDRRVARRWLVKDVAALWHSCPGTIGPRTRLRWMLRYFELCRITDPNARRSFLRAVADKRRRIAAHRPKELRQVVGSGEAPPREQPSPKDQRSDMPESPRPAGSGILKGRRA